MAAIVTTDILWKFSTTAGAAGNSGAGAASTSLGKYISTSQWAGGVLNDLFDNISGAENAASTVDYRGLFLHNNNSGNTLLGPTIYISAETAGGASIALATDNIATSVLASASAQMAQIASETSAPAGTSAFSSPTTAATGLAMSDIPIGQVKGFWVKRIAANTAALSADGMTLAWSGDTGSL